MKTTTTTTRAAAAAASLFKVEDYFAAHKRECIYLYQTDRRQSRNNLIMTTIMPQQLLQCSSVQCSAVQY